MICTKCHSAFCWLCDKKLPPEDPYSHFREVNTRIFPPFSSIFLGGKYRKIEPFQGGQCANRLFEGSVNDFDDFLEDEDEEEECKFSCNRCLYFLISVLPEDYDSDESILSHEGAIYFDDYSDDSDGDE